MKSQFCDLKSFKYVKQLYVKQLYVKQLYTPRIIINNSRSNLDNFMNSLKIKFNQLQTNFKCVVFGLLRFKLNYFSKGNQSDLKEIIPITILKYRNTTHYDCFQSTLNDW